MVCLIHVISFLIKRSFFSENLIRFTINCIFYCEWCLLDFPLKFLIPQGERAKSHQESFESEGTCYNI